MHIPPEAFLIQDQMEELVNWYDKDAQLLHPIERAAMLHVHLEGIHPFVDGNGRTARLLLNLELMKSGFPPIIIQAENRLEYYNALDKAHPTAEMESFLKLVIVEVERTLDLYLGAV